jgi:glycosyltransferase involved in cell wall biosynthesis
LARSKCNGDYCWQIDGDEIVHEKDYDAINRIIANNQDVDIFDFGVVTFYGDLYHMAVEGENWWKWRLSKNKPEIMHGVHKQARQYNTDGIMYFDKKVSDSCEYIDANTQEIYRHSMFVNPSVEQYRKACIENSSDVNLKAYGSQLSRMANNTICVYHYSWYDFERKFDNGHKFWSKSYAYRNNLNEHSNMFSDTENKSSVIESWNDKLKAPVNVVSHPQVMQSKLSSGMRPRIVNISLDRYGRGGVAVWGRFLEKHFNDDYEVVWYAFNDYIGSDNNTIESEKARSFGKWLIDNEMLRGADTIFVDGFWGMSLPDDMPVISVIHGIWTHPTREVVDDGLLKIRQFLFEKQLEYWRNTSHKLVCVSPFVQRILKDEHGIETQLIPNVTYLDDTFVPIEKTKPLILHGITAKHKGSDILNHIKCSDAFANFDIMSLDEAGKHFNVRKEWAMANADVLFAPSAWEANSYLLLEAMAFDIPIITYNTGLPNDGTGDARENPWEEMPYGIRVNKYDKETYMSALMYFFDDNRSVVYQPKQWLIDNNYTISAWIDQMKEAINGI